MNLFCGLQSARRNKALAVGGLFLYAAAFHGSLAWAAAPVGQTITLRATNNNNFVSADQNLGANAPLSANRAAASTWEQFTVVNAGNGLINLRSVGTGRFVSADQNLGGNAPLVADRATASAWEQFQWVDSAAGQVQLKSMGTGRFVSADLNLGTNAPLVADRATASGWETFSWAAAGGTGGGGGGGGGGTPGHEFAPYIDIAENTHNLAQISSASGIKLFTLAFIIDNGGCRASWGGLGNSLPADNYPDNTTVLQFVNALRAQGGDIIISFGGAAGTELGVSCTSAGALQAQIQSVINKYNARRLDFDIEGAALSNRAANDRRNVALAALQAANPNLTISYTLPVGTSGMDQEGIDLMVNAKSHGVRVSVLNIMTMDYGGGADPNRMGQNAIDATNGTMAQMRANGITVNMGITPMIGLNDSQPEVTTLGDANQILGFARSTAAVTRLSFWSVSRDNGSCRNSVSESCSGIAQNPWDFSHIFEGF